MKTVFLGELLMRLDTRNNERFVQAGEFGVRYTGAEANAAVSMANYGQDAWVVSLVPDNEIGQACINYFRKYGVRTEYISKKPGRLGIFFLETGASQRPSKVIYDRSDSVMARARSSDFYFKQVFSGKDWFHFSGTLPALSPQTAELTRLAVMTAREKGLTISCDLNYRQKLWTPDEAQKIMIPLMEHVDILIGNEEDAATALGIAPANIDVTDTDYQIEPYCELSKKLYKSFNLKYVAMTFRKNISASVNKWSAGLYDGEKFMLSKEYTMQVVDRVGGGDSFSGGLIYALQDEMSTAETIEFAVCASCLKHSIPGDFNHVSREEVLTLMNGDGSGRVQR